jgi:hypothetical protein
MHLEGFFDKHHSKFKDFQMDLEVSYYSNGALEFPSLNLSNLNLDVKKFDLDLPKFDLPEFNIEAKINEFWETNSKIIDTHFDKDSDYYKSFA